MTSGMLIMAGNSLGNLKDIPARSLELIRTTDLLVFEEDKIARQCLKAAGVQKNYHRLSEHKEADTLERVREALKNGRSVLYMSDQGMPNFADPGRELLVIAEEVGAELKVIPGPNSISAALSVCMFNVERFIYYGFLPRERGDRLIALAELAKEKNPVVILDAPYRKVALIEDAAKIFAGRRRGFLAVEIGNKNEKYFTGTFEQLGNFVKTLGKDENFVLIIDRA